MHRTMAEPGWRELYKPKLVTVLREGYGLRDLRADLVAGLTVAIVALPLSMAIAIASGVTPDRGLYTAIVGGFLVSLLGGSRFQIGGPAGAFIVLVAASVERLGVGGMALAVILSGLILMTIGALRLGTFIKYIPYPVTVGFTAGIAVIIAASQARDLLGLTLPGKEPGPFVPKLLALGQALPTLNPAALGTAVATIALIVLLRRWRPQWPVLLIAVAAASVVAALAHLPVETIGTRFGGIPRSLPAPHLPPVSPDLVLAVLPDAVAFALLGAIESLLSAVVADGMTGRRHRANAELVAQGVANIASALCGGICVTGTIARTATNVRAGARGPVSGMAHAVFLALFMAVAAPLASYIPLPALAAVLAIVAWNMAEKHAFGLLLRASWGDAAVLLSTFLLTVLRDLTLGIVVGFATGSLLFIHRMAGTLRIEGGIPLVAPDVADRAGPLPDQPQTRDDDILVFRLSGAFFFGAAAGVSALFDRIAARPRAYVLDLTAVPLLDSTAVTVIDGLAAKARKQGAVVAIALADPEARRLLLTQGLKPPRVHVGRTLDQALVRARRALGRPGDQPDTDHEAA
ncbi:SulP family inorganic anion transporter [Nitrospirillum viridazoti]|uniref:Sodium-independent anion transporter n=1 Tax=Nitrospirillum viridazoti CBAmc TaxID=1441467 RepID=A0A248JXN5_9PROT|nr:SulP family inorganic anion transporter [Nitrospirillum amazonense]ASG22888.1 sodium-independent anion transporter [Nitrospirillum amazonense CBAmc]TWB31503.1 SulP family sulfate permease [Nitrospirillum amazonense]